MTSRIGPRKVQAQNTAAVESNRLNHDHFRLTRLEEEAEHSVPLL
jgi:hypothetical protein